MKPAELINAWLQTPCGPSSWLAACAGETDPIAIARACAETLAKPMAYEAVIRELIDKGEFEGAELLMQEDGLLDAVGADVLPELEAELEQARATTIEGIRIRLADLQIRAEAHKIPVDAETIVGSAKRKRLAGLALLEQVERRIDEAEATLVRELRVELEAADRRNVPENAFFQWHADVEHAISLGALDAARAAIEAGPSTDRPNLVGVPSPPVWPYRSEPLHFLVEWMFGDGVVPPGFERYRPEPSDSDAWSFLKELRKAGLRPDAKMLSSLAGVLDSKVLQVEVSEQEVFGRLNDLGAPGFHAFGRRAWPEGIPVCVPAGDELHRREEAEDALIIQVAVGPQKSPARHVLRLDVHDVLAVLHDRQHRRTRLLAQLGRQLPLDQAFTDLRADESTRWERSDLPKDLVSRPRPVLLVGSPGMGKSTLLLELAQDLDATVEIVSAVSGRDLPEAGVVLIDDADRLGPNELRGFVRDIHWARTTRTPSPAVIVAIRPDKVATFERVAEGMFDVVDLPPRSFGALREQARTMLGWVGVEATAPRSYDRLAFLSGGNPTVLFLLCRALTAALAQEDGTRRRFTPRHVDLAWQDPALHAHVRELLWPPLQSVDGLADVLQVLVDFCEPGETLALDDATWAINETLGERDPAWIQERLSLLARYGLIRQAQGRVGMVMGGAGLLGRLWIEDDARDR